MGNWIKINREITNHWLWEDAERLKWWFDLLFMASWDDHKVMHDSHLFVLHKGELIASVSFLVERWDKSKPTIIRFLTLLQQEGMISRRTLYRQTPIITICNYERYQEQDNTNVDTLTDTQVDTLVDPIVYPNKEGKEYNISSSTTIKRACAREENPDYIAELKTSPLWLEQMAMKFRLSPDELVKRLNDFALDLKCRGTEHRNLTDTKRHFCDWLRIQIQSEKRQQQDETNRRNTQDKRRGAEVTATKAEDYEGAF